MTTDKALDLALEALEESVDLVREDYENAKKLYSNYPSRQARLLGLEDGLSKHEAAITAIKQARALDKKAENARELGLDYEPHKGMSEHLAQATNGRVRIDPVTGNVGIGTPPAQPAPVQDKVTLIQTNVGIGERAMEAYEASKERDRAALAAPTVQEPFGYLEIEDIESHSEYPHNCRSVNLWHEGGEGMVAIYTAPPAAQRPWVGLTDEEIEPYYAANKPLIKWVEAKLKEKNT